MKDKSEIEKLVDKIYHKQTYGKDADKDIEKLKTLLNAPPINPRTKLRVGNKVTDIMFGNGKIVAVLKTRIHVYFPLAPEREKDKNGNVSYDYQHANQFLKVVKRKKTK